MQIVMIVTLYKQSTKTMLFIWQFKLFHRMLCDFKLRLYWVVCVVSWSKQFKSVLGGICECSRFNVFGATTINIIFLSYHINRYHRFKVNEVHIVCTTSTLLDVCKIGLNDFAGSNAETY